MTPRSAIQNRGMFGCLISATVAWFSPRPKRANSLRLGQYELERKIGEGGMGIVYLARHARHGSRTALKVQKADRGSDAAARFDREARLTSELQHPNTVSVRDYGRTADGVPYYAMELLEGATLEQVVESTGPLSPARVVHVLRGVLSALAEVHDKGFVHRDIKPSNVFLCDGDERMDSVKLLDFGLVKDLNADGTEQDKLLGTPQYLAPESIASPADVDARTDLYAVGALAYYLLTGEAPFVGRSLVEVCSQHLHTTPVAPSQKAPHGLPAALEALVLECLAKRQRDRPASARVLLERLAQVETRDWSASDATSWWATHGALVSARRDQESSDALPVSDTFPVAGWAGAA